MNKTKELSIRIRLLALVLGSGSFSEYGGSLKRVCRVQGYVRKCIFQSARALFPSAALVPNTTNCIASRQSQNQYRVYGKKMRSFLYSRDTSISPTLSHCLSGRAPSLRRNPALLHAGFAYGVLFRALRPPVSAPVCLGSVHVHVHVHCVGGEAFFPSVCGPSPGRHFCI